MSDLDPADLIASIEIEARGEADKVLAEAEKTAAEQRDSAEQQAARITREAEEKAAEKIIRLKKAAESAISVENRRISLGLREKIFEDLISSVRSRFGGMIEEKDYKDVLLGWIVEAAIGLNVAEADVTLSKRDRSVASDGLLREAEKEVKGLTDRSTRLSFSTGDTSLDQGVILTSRDGRLAFNNQLLTRLKRYDSEIRRIVFKELTELS